MGLALAVVIVALPFLPFIYTLVARIEPDPARIVVNFHTAFNLALAALFILPIDLMAKGLIRLLPDRPPSADRAVPRYLEEAALSTASVACSSARVMAMPRSISASLR